MMIQDEAPQKPPKNKGGRPRKLLNVDANGIEHSDTDLVNIQVSNNKRTDASRIMAGLSCSSLANMFKLHRQTVQRKLSTLKPLGKVNGAPVYSIVEAAPYLCKPVIDIESYMKNLKPADLPASLQKDYWQAMLNKQKWEENAGHLFRAELIAEKLGDVFKTIKNTSRLWIENMDQEAPLTDEQRSYLNMQINSLMTEVYEKMLDFGQDTSVPSQLSELAELDQGIELQQDDDDCSGDSIFE